MTSGSLAELRGATIALGCRRADAADAGVGDRVAVTLGDGTRRATVVATYTRELGPLFVAIIFAFTSIAVVNTLAMIALQRGRELGLLQLVWAGPRARCVRWHAGRPA